MTPELTSLLINSCGWRLLLVVVVTVEA